MKFNILFISLFLYINAISQSITRNFTLPNSSIQYSSGSSAPIEQTPDSGYILNYGYSYPNWDAAPPLQTTIIKTDSNFLPIWSKKLPGGNGKKTIVLNDGSSIYFCNNGILVKVDNNGQTLFSIGNFTNSPNELFFSDAVLMGNIIKVVGSLDTRNGFGYITNSIPIIIDFDINGNVLQSYSLTDTSITYIRPTNIDKDINNNYYLSGVCLSNGNYTNYVCKINSVNSVVWSKRFFYTTSYNSSITINNLKISNIDDILLSGHMSSNSIAYSGPLLFRLNTNGNQLFATLFFSYTGSFEKTTELNNGDVIATGWLRENNNSFNRTFSMKINSNYTYAWTKKYNEGFGISSPFIKNQNDWYYSAFHYNNNDNNNPIIFNTDNTGITTCPNNTTNSNMASLNIPFNSIQLTLSSLTSLNTPTSISTFAPESQVYVDNCIPLLSLNENKKESSIIIYPNPTSDYIIIDSDNEIIEVIIFDLNGRKINNIAYNNNKIFLENLKVGIYIAKLKDINGNTSIEKIIKK